jgi:hypothetical protein
MEHVTVVEGVGYCPRHAGIIRALAQSAAKSERPKVASRAPSMIHWVAEALGPEIAGMAAGLGRRGDYTLYARVMQMFLDEPMQHHRWERSWELHGPSGVFQIYVDATEETDIVIRVRLDEKVLLRTVPPWIENHQNGTPPDDEQRVREQFFQRVVFMIAQGIEVGQRETAALTGMAHPAARAGQLPPPAQS